MRVSESVSTRSILLFAFVVAPLFVGSASNSEALAQGFKFTPDDDYDTIEEYTSDELAPNIRDVPPAAMTLRDGYVEAESPLREEAPLAGMSRSLQQIPNRKLSKLPASYSLKDFMPKPGKQAFNDCVGWAVAYATYSSQLGISRRRTPKERFDLFSPAFIYNQINEGKDAGCYLFHRRKPDAIELVIEKGCASEATMPYSDDPEGWKVPPPSKAMDEARNFVAIKHQRARNLTQIKRAIFENHPVVLSIYMDKKFKSNSDKSVYVWKGDKPNGHAVCAIGYDDKKEALLLINSWGTGWKNGGYCWASYDNFKRNKRQSFKNANGIGKRYWCVEAHVIKVGIPLIPKFASTASRDFVLTEDNEIRENGKRISPRSWSIADTACTEDSLYALQDNGTISLLIRENGGNVWVDLTKSQFPFGVQDSVLMIASNEKFLIALSKSGSVYRYGFDDNNTRRWKKAQIPSDPRVIDLRAVDGAMRATTDQGLVYGRNLAGEWTRPVFSKN